ncbi:MAG: hypothetical protein LBC41_08110 [Clostridiales bacterium]|jgi:hypothetical protein|nr:hypothetical protein [Clostridiales bacterium]
MDKRRDALKIISSCAKAYRDNLVGKKVLFVYLVGNKIDSFEAEFQPANFCHLTGVETVNGKNEIKGKYFYELVIKNKLPLEAFNIKSDGTTALKLNVLSDLMEIHKTARFFGHYSRTKGMLSTDVLTGNNFVCALGFESYGGVYRPNTALNLKRNNFNYYANIKYPIVAIFIKGVKEEKYKIITYFNNKLEINNRIISTVFDDFYQDLSNAVDFDNLNADFPIERPKAEAIEETEQGSAVETEPSVGASEQEAAVTIEKGESE